MSGVFCIWRKINMAQVNKWGATKLASCPTHGDKHLLSSGLCTDLSCIKKVIYNHSKTWKMISKNWRIIVSLGCDDDCCIFLVNELLREEKQYNKKPTLNPWWLKFRLKKYMVQGVKFSNLPIQLVPENMKNIVDKHLVSYDKLKEEHPDFFEDILHNAMGRQDEDDIPAEQALIHRQLMEEIGKKFGEPLMLYLKDEINRGEFVKLSGLTIEGALLYKDFAREAIKHFYIHGEWTQADIDERIKYFWERYSKKNKANYLLEQEENANG